MTDNVELVEKREKLKGRLAAEEYKSLVRAVADKVNLLLQRLTRSGPLPYWVGIVVFVAIVSVIGLLSSIIIGGSIFDDRNFQSLLTVGFLLVYFIAVEANLSMLFTFVEAHFLDSLQSVTDLADLQGWLETTFSGSSMKKQLFIGLVVSLVAVLFIGNLTAVIANQLNFGLFVSNWVLVILGGSYFYIFYRTFLLSGRLRQYQIKLYQANPSRSEVLGHLTDLFNFNMYTVAILVAIVTFIVVSFFGWTISNVILLAILVWGPTITLFAGNQYTFSKIISRAKWKTLNNIQQQVEQLQAQEAILSEETLGHIDKLMDYHDRIAATKNSALDIRAGLNFLNSLLIPLLAFILANLNDIIEFFSN